MVAGATSTVFFNEIHYDNTGPSDIAEFIEIANTAGTDLTGWSVVLYDRETPYQTLSLTGSALYTVFTTPLQNGTRDGMALVNGAGVVVQFLSYEGVITATSGAANGLTSTDIGHLERGTTGVAGQSIQMVGTGTAAGDFTWAAPAAATSGAKNTAQTVVVVNAVPTDFADNLLGSDTLNDIIIALKGDDVINGRGGDDFILGNKGNDTINGGEGADTLYGGTQNDTIHGGGGNDMIFGDQHDDQLWGDGGADIFVFNHKNFGDDTIHDFANGADHITFGEKSFTAFYQVQAAAQQSGANVVITDGIGNSVTILNFTLAQLTVDDILFI